MSKMIRICNPPGSVLRDACDPLTIAALNPDEPYIVRPKRKTEEKIRARFFPEVTSENTLEVKIPEGEYEPMTIWEAERLNVFASKYARKENGNIVCDCINTSTYVSQVNTYENGKPNSQVRVEKTDDRLLGKEATDTMGPDELSSFRTVGRFRAELDYRGGER